MEFLNRVKSSLRPYRWLHYVLSHGVLTLEELKLGHLSYSQFGEDLILDSLFGRDSMRGFYVDVGAYHPVYLSNTHRFYKRGWRGINIEPNPKSFKEIAEARKDDINLNVAVSESASTVQFFCDGVYSGIDDDSYLHGAAPLGGEIVNVLTFPLSQILGKYMPSASRIDFLSVDCEGHDLAVLQSNDWTIYRPKVVLVEQHGVSIDGEIFNFLTNLGYAFYCKTGLTMFFLDKDEFRAYFPL